MRYNFLCPCCGFKFWELCPVADCPCCRTECHAAEAEEAQ